MTFKIVPYRSVAPGRPATTTARYTSLIAVVSFGLLAAAVRPTAATAPQAPAAARSIVDGVFTAEQATRGEELYLSHCSSCHGATLAGGETGPTLVGPDFLSRWIPGTVAEVVEFIRTTMPQDNPGSLSARQSVDILTQILNANGYPAGATPLEGEVGALKQIKWELPKK